MPLPATLTGVDRSSRWNGSGDLLLTCGHDQGAFNRVQLTEVEVRRLLVAKRPACSLRPVVGGFPGGVAQKVAQLREVRCRHPLLDPS